MRIRIAQALVIVLAIASLGAARRPISTGAMNYAPGPSKVAAAALSGQPKPFQVGPASWYGEDFHGRATASGEPYNMFDLTAAHLTLPLGTRVKVTNIRNGHSVIVRINDRGPVVPGRIIDLSYRAARTIDMRGTGVQRVRLDMVELHKFEPRKQPRTQTVAMLRRPAFQHTTLQQSNPRP